jgi:ferric-dicitrate binding protein FerR (iron transport regulator)
MDLKNKRIKLIFKKLTVPAYLRKKIRFEDRMGNDPGHFKRFEDMEGFWQDAEKIGLFSKIDKDSDWEKVRVRIQIPRERKYVRIPTGLYLARIAAMLILVSGLSFGFYKLLTSVQKPETTFVSLTAMHGLKEIGLPDGSCVTLNAGSTLTYKNDFSVHTREVILDGEALFDVKHDPEHPFRVFTGESMVEVTGTRFNIREAEGSVQVAVLDGTVILSSSVNHGKKISISANQSGYLHTDRELKLENKVETNVLSWKTGYLIFDESPIDSALMDIAHHFRKDLMLESDIKDQITAEFQNQTLDEILEELRVVAGLKFDTTGNALIVRK